MLDFNIEHYLETDYRYHDLSKELQRHMEGWLQSPSSPPYERVFNVVGDFGSGRSWLLQFVNASSQIDTSYSADLRFLERSYCSIYLDLNQGFGDQREMKAADFISQTKKRLNAMEKKCERRHAKLCLCVDHVPGRAGACKELQEFEEKILYSALTNKEVFLLLAQKYRRHWGFVSMIPHIEPWELPPFNREGVERLCEHYDVNISNCDDVFQDSFGNPYLATCLLHEDDPIVAYRRFIEGWIKSKGLSDQIERILKSAYPLSLIQPHKIEAHEKWKRVEPVLRQYFSSFGRTERHWKDILDDFRLDLEWLTFKRETDNGFVFRPRWVKVVQHSLQEMFISEDLNGYQKIKQVLQGGS